MTWKINNILQNDTILIIDHDLYQLRFNNKKTILWFILIPKVSCIEWYNLSSKLQHYYNNIINKISKYLKIHFKVDKINLAMIGNIVNQMHIHIIGRFFLDFYWPHSVWGVENKNIYKNYEIDNIKNKIIYYFFKK